MAKTMEAAWDREQIHQAIEWLEKLAAGKIRRANSDHLADLLLRIEDYCDEGELPVPDEMNWLRGDVWEIKAQNLRLPFFAVAGNERVSRATHGFVKGAQKAPRHEIDLAQGIQREDQKR